MMNSANGMMSASSSSATTQSPALKTYFKTPEGRYKLHYEKTHPSGLLHYAHGKTVTQVTLAHLKDKQAPSTPPAPPSSFSASSGVRSAAARLLGGSNGSRALSFVGGNGGSKSISGNGRVGSLGSSSSSNSMASTNFDGKGTYLVFNVGDAIFISDLNSQDKDPIKSIHFSNSNPVCHAFDQDARDGHDLLIGLNSGDVYSVSLRQQLQDVGKKLVGAQHYNKDGSVSNSRCTSVAWVPGGDGSFVVAHADGNLYVYEKSKDGAGDSSFPVVRDQMQFSVAHARYSKDDVIENSFNVLRMFVRIYGASKAPVMLAKYITEGEEKYDGLLKTLDPQLSSNYQKRCEEATKEGGKISGHRLGAWSIPPVIVDEELYRSNLQNSK